MATVSAFPLISSYTVFKTQKNPTICSNNFSYYLPVRAQFPHICISIPKRLTNLNKIRVYAAEGEDTVVPEQQEEAEPTVSVPVSASDILTMFFQAEGTMSDAAIPSVTNALKETEGISDLKVQVHEGIASVELKKKTTVQATGVASNLVEIIQNSGFKLQALNLSFEDEAGVAA